MVLRFEFRWLFCGGVFELVVEMLGRVFGWRDRRGLRYGGG